MTTIEGSLIGHGLRFALVASRTNQVVTQRLVEGAVDALRRHGVAEADVTVAWAPGSFELPLVARRLARSGRYDAVVCLGAVIRGDTPHWEYISAQVARGTAKAALEADLPVTFGVITCETLEQALDRAGGKGGNKGAEAALAALELANLLRQLS